MRILLLFTCLFALVSASEGWKPDYLIIGAQKAGTTELYRAISRHPSSVKKEIETHFFDLNFEKGTKWYEGQFPARTNSQTIIGDKSPYYFFHPLVPERVFSLYPNIKIVLILRNPADRAYSHYWHNIRLKLENLSFEDALNAEADRLRGEKEKLLNDPTYKSFNYQHYSYISRGLYAEQMKRWLAFFPKEQILIILTKDLRFKPEETMAKVFHFLNMPFYRPPGVYQNMKSEYPPMNPETRAGLGSYFQPFNLEFEELIGEKFNWR